VSGSKLDTVRRYIIRQKEHHIIRTFKEEVEESVRKQDIIEYDEKYFWE
jgi:putative transposase